MTDPLDTLGLGFLKQAGARRKLTLHCNSCAEPWSDGHNCRPLRDRLKEALELIQQPLIQPFAAKREMIIAALLEVLSLMPIESVETALEVSDIRPSGTTSSEPR